MTHRPPYLSCLLLSLGLAACGDKAGQDDTGNTGGGDPEACPALSLSTESIDFADVPMGSLQQAEVVLSNSCTTGDVLELWLSWGGDGRDAFLGAVPEQTQLLPGESVSIDVGYLAEDYTRYSSTITIEGPRGTSTVEVSGNADPDQDGDGYEAEEAGGDDCDDADPTRYPQEQETLRDLIDEDCDGTVDEDWVAMGDVIVSELMARPAAVADSYGEWLEVHNTTAEDLDLEGWRLYGDDGDEVFITGSLLLSAGGYLVLGREADATKNGGISPDFVYTSADFSLADSFDSVFLSVAGTPIFEVSYEDDWPLVDGASMALDPEFLDLDSAQDGALWCEGEDTYGAGDLGTPGSTNPWCSSVDHDGDGRSEDTFDCDDNDPLNSPGHNEIWDGQDNNCDGDVDIWDHSDAITTLDGEPYDAVGYVEGLSVGDLDGDGTAELIVGGSSVGNSNYYPGGAYVLDSSVWTPSAGLLATEAKATFTGSSDYNYLGILPPELGDHDDDGIVDLLVLGSEQWAGSSWAGDPKAGAIIPGGSAFTGALTTDDAWVTFTGSDSSSLGRTALAHVDVDGDGIDDVLYGDYLAEETGSLTRGAVYLFSASSLAGGGEFDLADADVIYLGAQSDYALGRSLGGGDLDRDGYDDLVLGAPGASINSSDSGAFFIIHGDADLGDGGSVTDLYDARIRGEHEDMGLGTHGSPLVHDFDGDGERDLVVSAPSENLVMAFFSAGDLQGAYATTDATVRIDGVGADWFGWSLSKGDYDGNGYDDLAIGAPDTDTANSSTGLDHVGEVVVFRGGRIRKATGWDSTDADLTFTGQGYYAFGSSVASGDFDGDGADELASVEPAYGGASSTGRALLFDPNSL